MRLTLSQLMGPVAATINLNASGQKVIDYINAAQEELLNMGRWVGTTIKYRLCSTGGFITWPREIETIEAMQIGHTPIQLHNQWAQFVDHGAGYGDRYHGGDWARGFHRGGIAIDAREAISFADVCPAGNAKVLKVYGTATEAVGSRILLQFYDGNGNYVRTNDATEGWVDGEFININPTSPQTTINAVSQWVGVQKPMTNGFVRITELDTVTNLERPLAVYEPSETNPSYRRSYLPGRCGNFPVTIIGSQRFIPALKPRDYLCISLISALKWKAKAVYLNDNNNVQEAAVFDQKAVSCLNDQLNKWTGSGNIQTPNFGMNVCDLGTSNFI